MTGVFEIVDAMEENEFQAMMRGKKLTPAEHAFLRRFYGLPYDEALVSTIGTHNERHYVAMAQQKIRGNPHV